MEAGLEQSTSMTGLVNEATLNGFARKMENSGHKGNPYPIPYLHLNAFFNTNGCN